MNFSEALKAMKMGSKVSREAWRGRKSYWYIPNGKRNIFEVHPDGRELEIVGLKTVELFFDDWWIVT